MAEIYYRNVQKELAKGVNLEELVARAKVMVEEVQKQLSVLVWTLLLPMSLNSSSCLESMIKKSRLLVQKNENAALLLNPGHQKRRRRCQKHLDNQSRAKSETIPCTRWTQCPAAIQPCHKIIIPLEASLKLRSAAPAGYVDCISRLLSSTQVTCRFELV